MCICDKLGSWNDFMYMTCANFIRAQHALSDAIFYDYISI